MFNFTRGEAGVEVKNFESTPASRAFHMTANYCGFTSNTSPSVAGNGNLLSSTSMT